MAAERRGPVCVRAALRANSPSRTSKYMGFPLGISQLIHMLFVSLGHVLAGLRDLQSRLCARNVVHRGIQFRASEGQNKKRHSKLRRR